MRLLISPAEPASLRALGKTSSAPERYGVDFLLSSRGRLVGIQRKSFPDDLLESMHDGRLQKELGQIHESSLDFALLLLEGEGSWTSEGVLLHDRSFNRGQLFGLLLSLQVVHGVHCLWSKDQAETIDLIPALGRWLDRPHHDSLCRRPGSGTENPFDRLGGAQSWFLQGIAGLGPRLAEAILEHFGGLPVRWICSYSELLQVEGIGPKRARAMFEFFGQEVA